jgi:peptide/nickel transport system substrate-binding protein
MRKAVSLALTVLVVLSFLLACAQPTPTAAPTKPGAPVVATMTAAPPTAAITALAAATKPATVAPTAVPTAKVKRGGTLRAAGSAAYPTMDPHVGSAFNQSGHRMLFDCLFRFDLVDEKAIRFEATPELVESWQMADPKTFLFKLRKGVKFHDGSVWNAEVAKFNLDRMVGHKKTAAKGFIASIASTDIVDENTVRVNLYTPSAALVVNLAGPNNPVSIISKVALDKLGDDGFGSQPVGSGPMEFQQWLRDDRLILKKFNGYWKMGADGQPLPYLDGFIDRQIVDPAITLMEMKAGTVDVGLEPDAKDVAGIKANPDLVYWEYPSAFSTRTIGFNQRNGPTANNLKVRQALLYAIDREAMAKTLSFGLGKGYWHVYWLPGYLGYDETLPSYKYDLTKAKQLLAEAGYPSGADILLSVIARPLDQRVGEMLKQMWDTAGFRTNLESIERLAWIEKLKNDNFNAAFWGGSPGSDPDQNTDTLGANGTGNWSGWREPRIEKCLEDGRSTYDPKQRDQVYKRCQQIIYEEAYVDGLYYWPSSVVYNKSVKGIARQWRTVDMRAAWLDK